MPEGRAAVGPEPPQPLRGGRLASHRPRRAQETHLNRLLGAGRAPGAARSRRRGARSSLTGACAVGTRKEFMAQTFETQSDCGDHNCFSESGVYEQQHAQGIMGSATLSHMPTAGVLWSACVGSRPSPLPALFCEMAWARGPQPRGYGLVPVPRGAAEGDQWVSARSFICTCSRSSASDPQAVGSQRSLVPQRLGTARLGPRAWC